MATNPAKRGALRALSLTMTAILLGVSVLAPAASALGGVPVDPDRVVRDAQGTADRVIRDALDTGGLPPALVKAFRSALDTANGMFELCDGDHWHPGSGWHWHGYGGYPPCEPDWNSPL